MPSKILASLLGCHQELLSDTLRRGRLSNKHYVSPFRIAFVYAGLNENNRAFECLEKAYEERFELLIELKTSLYFDPIRIDPRFPELLKKISFE